MQNRQHSGTPLFTAALGPTNLINGAGLRNSNRLRYASQDAVKDAASSLMSVAIMSG